jgi:predicted nucleic acid-binding protein
VTFLLDTNVLLRRTQPDHPLNLVAVESVAILLSDGEDVYFTPQNIAEFWNVVTRQIDKNGLGFDAATARREVDLIEQLLTILPDKPEMYEEWKRLVITHSVLGVKVHDARLVAAMNVHGIQTLLTFNPADFTRFESDLIHPIVVLHPSSVH